MLRSVRSVPALRQALPQQRSLASSVLLTSWTKARVPELKEELKKRGLSTQGKKADLLNRLTGHEMRTPKSTPSVPSFRQASSAIADKPESLTDAQIESLKDEKIISFPADAKVSSQEREGIPSAAELGESTTESPGMPENPFSSKPATLDYRLPEFKDEPEPATPIPWILAFHSDKFPSSKSSPTQAVGGHVQKLFTAADASTHLGGGPQAHLSSGVSSDPLSLDSELSDDNPSRKLNEGERRGLYVLAGIFAGAALLGGVVNPSKIKRAAKEGEKLVEEGKDKAKGLIKEGKTKGKEAVEAVKEKTVGK